MQQRQGNNYYVIKHINYNKINLQMKIIEIKQLRVANQ